MRSISPPNRWLLTAIFVARRLDARLHRARVRIASGGLRSLNANVSKMMRQQRMRVVARRPPLTVRHILIVDAGFPASDRDSASLRLINIVKGLVADGWHPVVVADDNSGDPREVCDAGADYAAFGSSAQLLDWLCAEGRNLKAAVLCRHGVASAWLPLLRAVAPAARIIFDTVDLHASREQREASLTGNRTLAARSKRTLRREQAIIDAADVAWVVSTSELSLLHDAGVRHVRLVSNIITDDSAGLDWNGRAGILFVGGFRHPPNVDAVTWFATDIWPRIHDRLERAIWHVVGSDMPTTLKNLLEHTPGVRVHGHVPNLKPLLEQCRIAVAPLRFGAGVKGKVNIAMAHGLPVIATHCAAEGMNVIDDVHVLIAESAEEFGQRILELYADQQRWERIAVTARDFNRSQFSLDVAMHSVRASLPSPV